MSTSFVVWSHLVDPSSPIAPLYSNSIVTHFKTNSLERKGFTSMCHSFPSHVNKTMFTYYSQIIGHPQWPQAMYKNFNDLLCNNSWTLKPITIQTKLNIDIIHCRFICTLILDLLKMAISMKKHLWLNLKVLLMNDIPQVYQLNWSLCRQSSWAWFTCLLNLLHALNFLEGLHGWFLHLT